MKKEEFWKALSDIDEDLVAEATAPRRNRRPVLRAAVSAAAVFLLFVGVWLAYPFGGDRMTAEDGKYLYAADLSNKGDLTVKNEMSDEAADGSFSANYSAPIDAPMTDVAADTAPDTAVVEWDKALPFYYKKEGVWTKETRPYPDGMPDVVALAADYLGDATTVLLAVRKDEIPATEVVSGGLVVYTPAEITLTFVFADDPGDDVRGGLLLTVSQACSARYLRMETASGEPLLLTGIPESAPGKGYTRDQLTKVLSR